MLGLSLTGVAEAQAMLERDKNRLAQGLTKGMEQIGFYMEGTVKESVAGQNAEPTSVDTGRFLNSITSSISSDLATHAQQVVIYTPLDYPFFLEYGTSHIAPRRHFGNTLAREGAHIVEQMQSMVSDAVEK